MFKVKHFMDGVEGDDGMRLWIEPIGLTRDLREMCRVGYVIPGFGPPRDLWLWFDAHPDGYEYFRGKYHEHLDRSDLRPLMLELAAKATVQNVTLLHQGSDPELNTAMALYEYLSELQAHCPPDF
jgi:uncharacterized protein YeaO (DUF488 family)